MELLYEGRCWMLGDDVSSDDLISARHVFEYDPEKLRNHLFEERNPLFARQVQAGDIVVAGRRFAHGSQHTHPFLALKAMGVGLMARQMLRPPFRLAVYCGVPLLEVSDQAYALLNDADRLRVNFKTGEIRNLTSGQVSNVTPLPGFLLEIIQSGGGLGYLKNSRPATSREASHDS